MNSLAEGRFNSVSCGMTPRLSSALSTAKLTQLWQARPCKPTGYRITASSGYTIVQIRCAGGAGGVDWSLPVSPAGLLAGIQMPVTGAASSYNFIPSSCHGKHSAHCTGSAHVSPPPPAPAPSCTTISNLQARLTPLNSVCCGSDGSGCAGGLPKVCPHRGACARMVTAVFSDCALVVGQPAVAGSLRPLAQACGVGGSGGH
jgi:hypothetical protein